jgi:5-methylcytosine-specific restriction endonuclease McrA
MKTSKPIKTRIVRKSYLRKLVFDRDQGFCCKCGRFDARWIHDHEVPLWFGGQDTLANSQTLCRRCERAKTSGETTKRAKIVRLHDRNELTKKRREIGNRDAPQNPGASDVAYGAQKMHVLQKAAS